MAIVTDRSRFILPQAYFQVSHGHLPELKLESGTVSAQIAQWSRMETFTKVTEYKPNENKIKLSNGKEFTYKALVVATGFEHKSEFIEGLPEFEKDRGENNVFVHAIDHKERLNRNYYHGWNHPNGDMICYSPKFPHKGEGTDFYALYYEHFLRQDQLQGRAAKNAKIQYWTPNKETVPFPYMNEVILDECKKRGIEVHFGWEMKQVKLNEHGQKIAVFKNVDSGEVIEKDFFQAVINPPSRPQQELIDAGLTDGTGLVDVNPYTLQHKKYENIFAFGDCINGATTRTQNAAIA
jgi:sulfide:quinone oxidoreductase